MSLQNIISKTIEYLNVPSVVRFEQPFMNYLADDFNFAGYDIEKQDRLLIVKKKGLKSSKIVTAHVDRHGIVVNDQGNLEYASFNAKKYYGDENKSSEAIFKKSGERFIDELVYAYDQSGKTIEEGIVKACFYDFDSKDLIFNVDGFDKLPANTPIAYTSLLKNENENISSQLDNVISVSVAYQLIKDGFDGTLLFSTEEEIGRSWQYISNYLESQNNFSKEIFTLDTTPYDNESSISKGLVVLRNKDENGIFNSDLVQKLKDACNFKGIMYEMKDEVIEAQNTAKEKKLGKTELGRIIEYTNGKLNGATIQLPTTFYHTNHETTSELALNNYYEVLKKLL